MLNIIVVIGKNKAIGCNNKLLWDIPEDMARFKRTTTGHPIIMGRKTFESIGRALPNRTNIIITRDKKYKADKCFIADSLSTAINLAKKSIGSDEIFIIGGGEIFKQALPYCGKLFLTIVDDAPEADTFFPDYSEFETVVNKYSSQNENLNYTFLELTKK